jgi:2,3,4,5-tetrahydropyridine-2,6-dicarboxylate N-succinyltransferase
MSHARLQTVIETAWDQRETISPTTRGEAREAVETALDLLDAGKLRVAEKIGGAWVVHQWLKKAVLISFRLNDMELIAGAPGGAGWWDKVPSKFAGMTAEAFKKAGYRAVPGAVVRRSAYIAPGVVLMPSFVNLGAYVGSGSMVDTCATVGSCAQIGSGVHLSGGVGIGGVLEPLQAAPVVIEDGAFIGSRCIVVEGVHVGGRAVLGAGVVLTANTPVIDPRGDAPVEYRGHVPPGAIVVPGTRPKSFPAGDYGMPCGLIIGERTDATDDKVQLNELLRDAGSSTG